MFKYGIEKFIYLTISFIEIENIKSELEIYSNKYYCAQIKLKIILDDKIDVVRLPSVFIFTSIISRQKNIVFLI